MSNSREAVLLFSSAMRLLRNRPQLIIRRLNTSNLFYRNPEAAKFISSLNCASIRETLPAPNGSNGQKNGKKTDGFTSFLNLLGSSAILLSSILLLRTYYDDIEQFFKSRIFVYAARKLKKEAAPEKPTLTSRELRFLKFASVEYEGQIFMTPLDFLDCVTQEQARAREKRRALSEDDVKKMLKKTPQLKKGAKNLFRQINERGLISYTEYLFLLCILTKPQAGFRIAFNMFDTDGNQRVDKKEFLVIQALTLMLRAGGKIAEFDPYLDTVSEDVVALVAHTSLALRKQVREQIELSPSFLELETVFASSRRKKQELQLRQYEKAVSDASDEVDEHDTTDDDEPTKSVPKGEVSTEVGHAHPHETIWTKTENLLKTMNVQDTTLLMHFFGSKGDRTLSYDDFHRFMENLQTEVLEIEFLEFSRGKPTITESDFATVLLRYTVARPDDYKAYMERVRERIPDTKGITFEQFRQFCQFLTCLDDFTIAVKLYTFADMPVSQPEFARAVKVSTGFALDPHVIDTVFQIFDVNNDNRLSYSEFIRIMRDRLHRGLKAHVVRKDGWEAYKQCVRAEMRRY